ncbi:MAG TPA: peptidylprolyl isomerase [Candidatus Binatia bacterium]|nr:peptidylprolyl isomerase [Candidatus Binatia bacterium]
MRQLFPVKMAGPILALACALGACSRDPEMQPVAKVNGEDITRFELDLAERRTLGGVPAQDPAVRRKILESMAMSRAIAQAAEPELDKHERRIVEAELKSYRDQFLTRMYLARHKPPQAIGEEAIRQYYERNPGMFGGGEEYRFEAIVSGELAPDARAKLRLALEEAAARSDWDEVAPRLGSGEAQVQYRRGGAAELALTPQLRPLVEGAELGGKGRVAEIDGRLYLVRAIERRPLRPRPLDEVRGDITRALAAIALRDQVQVAGKDVLQHAKVEYLD